MQEQDRDERDYRPDESGDDMGGGPVGGADVEEEGGDGADGGTNMGASDAGDGGGFSMGTGAGDSAGDWDPRSHGGGGGELY